MKLLTEFVGSFLFMLVIALIGPTGAPQTAFAIGGGLMAMIYMGGHVSGAHYNPAVSLAILIAGKMTVTAMLQYWAMQIAGALAAFFVGAWIVGGSLDLKPAADFSRGQALAVEILFTAMLVLTVLHVALAKKAVGNSVYGLAIAAVVVCGILAGGGISGGAFNPAVGIGATVVNAVQANGDFASLWLYLVGPFLGAAIAAFVFKLQGGEEAA